MTVFQLFLIKGCEQEYDVLFGALGVYKNSAFKWNWRDLLSLEEGSRCVRNSPSSMLFGPFSPGGPWEQGQWGE